MEKPEKKVLNLRNYEDACWKDKYRKDKAKKDKNEDLKSRRGK